MARAASLLIAGVTAAVASAHAQTGRTALLDTLAARSLAFYKSSGTPGLAVGVWKDGKVIYARGFGVLAAGEPQPVTPRTIFHMASVSKTFVATAVMQLMEQGKVRLDDPITKYVPYFQMKDSRYQAITIRQLLSHTAGMPDVTDYAWDTPQYDDQALERWIRGLKDSTLIAAPGEKWQYSNIGFELLADLVAIVSGETFEAYVQRHILTPAGMAHSTFLMTDVDSANLALGHESSPSGERRGYPYNRRHAGSGTMHSNVEDMLRYGAVHAGLGTLDGKQVLRPTTYDVMWKVERDISANYRADMEQFKLTKVEMALGWFVREYNGVRVMNHFGQDRGFRSALLVLPDRKTVVVVLVNSAANPTALAFPLLAAAIR